MSELTNLKPAEVFYYFDKICSIPHGSGNTKAISDYCADFAREHGLRYIQDPADNIIIFKDGTPGYENSAPVIIQGHLDMVCEKDKDCSIDMEKEGLRPVIEGDMVTAEGTTLGGDDGIAVAYALAILASDIIPHPPIEAVFTSDEEIGLLGATAIDTSQLKGRIMLNIDIRRSSMQQGRMRQRKWPICVRSARRSVRSREKVVLADGIVTRS